MLKSPISTRVSELSSGQPKTSSRTTALLKTAMMGMTKVTADAIATGNRVTVLNYAHCAKIVAITTL